MQWETRAIICTRPLSDAWPIPGGCTRQFHFSEFDNLQVDCTPPGNILAKVVKARPSAGNYIGFAVLAVAGEGTITEVEIKGQTVSVTSGRETESLGGRPSDLSSNAQAQLPLHLQCFFHGAALLPCIRLTGFYESKRHSSLDACLLREAMHGCRIFTGMSGKPVTLETRL